LTNIFQDCKNHQPDISLSPYLVAHYPRIVSDGDIHLVISGHLMV
jgi:hypothetical protein